MQRPLLFPVLFLAAMAGCQEPHGQPSTPPPAPSGPLTQDEPGPQAAAAKKVGMAKEVGPKPNPTQEGEEWNHAELLAYLQGKGLSLLLHKAGYFPQHGPAVYLMPDTKEFRDMMGMGVDHFDAAWDLGNPMVFVQKMRSAQEAHDQAGVLGDDVAFSWGRFLVRSNGANRASLVVFAKIMASLRQGTTWEGPVVPDKPTAKSR